ncbi:MAG: DUF3131 domain-containing protein [Pseudomonadota bacterium]
MSNPKPPFNNRSSILFALGLALSAGLAIGMDGVGALNLRATAAPLQYKAARLVQAPAALSPVELAYAKVAWSYFEDNHQPTTGLVDSVAGFPSGTLWDQGSYLFALIAAERLSILEKTMFDDRVAALLDTLAALSLFDGKLPNKVYDTRSLQMVDYANTPVEDGIGWSALDVARMLMALRVLETRHQTHAAQVRAILANWDVAAMAKDGRLWGTTRADGEIRYLQEGRIGYEQYAARAAALWGLDVITAGSAQSILGWTDIEGVQVPVDLRTSSSFRAITPTLSEPYVLLGLEMGFDRETAILADRVYSAQEQRHVRTGIPTMVSEDNIDQAPYFLYSSVYSNGRAWAVVDDDGEHFPELRTVSTKAAFGWDALYGTEYAAQVVASLRELAADGGWASGRYEVTGNANDVTTLNTNAVVLEALHFKAFGPFWSFR